MPLLPAWPFDLGDGLVDQYKRPREITSLGHALGQNGFKAGTGDPTTALLPDTEAPFEHSRPFSDLTLPDQPDTRKDWHEAVGHKRQVVFARHAIGLGDPLQ